MMLNKLSLNTIGLNRIGLNRIGKPSRGSSGRPYIDPEVLSALKAVCICYGKSNGDPDRAIVKNLVDPDNPFVISNAAYKLNSGYGLYGMDFLEWKSNSGMSFTSTKLTSTKPNLSGGWLTFRNVSGLIPETKVKVSGAPREFGFIANNNGTDDKFSVTINNGVYTIPEFTLSSASGFYINNNSGDWSNLVIEQIPSYQGAFVTDGIDDLITSTKTVQEMGITKACTVISMIHHMDVPSDASFNNIRNSTAVSGRNGVYASGTTGIYGWSKDDVSGTSTTLINNILGDKNNYTNGGGGSAQVDNMKFSVQGFISDSGVISETSQVAWYWTIIANKVLTTDQINQVIAYFNLDRCVEPTVLYDVKRQGLSNDTPDSDWYLKDFSKNSFDMSLFNFAKKGNSGIGKYEADFTSWKKAHFTDEVNTSSSKIEITGTLTTNSILINTSSTPMYNVKIHTPNKSIVVYFQYDDGTGIKRISLVEGINELPSANESIFVTSDRLNSKGITITQIPSHASALCFDGVEDYGKVTGLPIYKDYTVVADYERIDIGNIEGIGTPPVLSKSYTVWQGSFIMNFIASTGNSVHTYSFGTENISNFGDLARQIYYQSKYKSQGFDITAGTGIDGDSLWLGTTRDNDRRFFNGAIYSLMSFPYSMSEFLIERQLKKHKLGTLYPDMVEFRPVITINGESGDISYANDKWENINIGDYINIGEIVHILLYRKDIEEISNVKVNGAKFQSIDFDSTYNHWNINIELTSKSPQKIDITIDQPPQYLTMLSNSTLISNETLIKNE